MNSVVEDPFGAGTCLILVGLFFAGKLYKMTLLTISDYYRERFGRTIEVVCSLIIILSYLGWVSAQVTALGLVFNLLSDGAISVTGGHGASAPRSILAYTLFGGMWSVAVTDFIQMIILVVRPGDHRDVRRPTMARRRRQGDRARDQQGPVPASGPSRASPDVVFFIAAGITMMLGSIPQQDVFQRVMSANSDVKAATRGPVIGGACYILFAFVPMFLVTSALIIMPEQAATLIKEDPQKVLPTLVLEQDAVRDAGAVLRRAAVGAQVDRLGDAAGAVGDVRREHLAPVLPARERQEGPVHDAHRGAGVQRAACCAYAIALQGTPIYEHGLGRLPGHAGRRDSCRWQPGLYWKRATHAGRDLLDRARHR